MIQIIRITELKDTLEGLTTEMLTLTIPEWSSSGALPVSQHPQTAWAIIPWSTTEPDVRPKGAKC